jgi:hypothetical protein
MNRISGLFELKLVGLLALSMSVGGCSVIGLTVGSRIDDSHSRPSEDVSTEVLPALKDGTRVTLVMADSSLVDGTKIDPEYLIYMAIPPTHLRIDRGRGARTDIVAVPLAQVRSATIPPERHAARQGFRTGLMADLTVLMVVVAVALYVGLSGVPIALAE